MLVRIIQISISGLSQKFNILSYSPLWDCRLLNSYHLDNFWTINVKLCAFIIRCFEANYIQICCFFLVGKHWVTLLWSQVLIVTLNILKHFNLKNLFIVIPLKTALFIIFLFPFFCILTYLHCTKHYEIDMSHSYVQKYICYKKWH